MKTQLSTRYGTRREMFTDVVKELAIVNQRVDRGEKHFKGYRDDLLILKRMLSFNRNLDNAEFKYGRIFDSSDWIMVQSELHYFDPIGELIGL